MSIDDNLNPAAPAEELDDFDVEGHGMREIALGLSAASIVAGGAGAAALALDNPAPGTTAGVQKVAAGVQSDVTDRTGWAARTAGDITQTTRGVVADAQGVVSDTRSSAITAVQPIGDAATDAVNSTTTLAKGVVADPVGATDRSVDGAVTTVRTTRDGAVTTALGAERTAMDAVRDGLDTAVSTVDGARTTVSGARGTAMTTANDAYKTVDPQASVSSDEDGTTVSAGAADKSVTVHQD